jgi:putative ABC transport system permease protein
MIWQALLKSGFDQMPVTPPDHLDGKQPSQSGLNMSSTGEPERLPAARSSQEFLAVLGINPVVGRNFLPEENRPGGPPTVIISHVLWQIRYHSDPLGVGHKPP